MTVSPFFLSAQGITSPVTFTVLSNHNQVIAGEPFVVTIRADIEGKWHLYSLDVPPNGPIATTFTISNDSAILLDSLSESKPESVYDPNFDIQLGWHTSFAEFYLPIVVTAQATGNLFIDVNVRYMVCDDSMCLPPTTRTVSIPAKVTSVNDTAIQNYLTDISNSGSDVNSPLSSSQSDNLLRADVWSFIWLALTAGFAALLTPCVFPMIPLTVSYFSKQGDGSRAKAVSNALFYGLSIILTFTILGAILSLALGASGVNQFASNPWVNLFIGVIFVLFAISLLGLFELRLPHQLTNYLNRQSNTQSGFVGIIFMGLTISAVSFSCTAPFVGAILAATTKGAWFYPIIGMVIFSTAFALPFIVFAMFPSWLESLPQSGSWMNSVKVILGFVEFAAAYKFISNADLVWGWGMVSRPFTIASWIVLAFLAGFYLLGKLQMKYEKQPEFITTLRLLFSLPFFIFAVYLIPGLLGASLGIWDAWLPPKQATDVSVVAAIGKMGGSVSNSNDEGWYSTMDEVNEVAKTSGKYVFIDFTGYTCTNCRAMESNIFPLDDVKESFQKYERVKLYTDGGKDASKNQLYQFELTGTVALPTYAIINPKNGNLVDRISGYMAEEKFLKFLNRTK